MEQYFFPSLHFGVDVRCVVLSLGSEGSKSLLQSDVGTCTLLVLWYLSSVVGARFSFHNVFFPFIVRRKMFFPASREAVPLVCDLLPEIAQTTHRMLVENLSGVPCTVTCPISVRNLLKLSLQLACDRISSWRSTGSSLLFLRYVGCFLLGHTVQPGGLFNRWLQNFVAWNWCVGMSWL